MEFGLDWWEYDWFVLSQPIGDINELVKAIEDADLLEHREEIIDCAVAFNRITVNHNAK